MLDMLPLYQQIQQHFKEENIGRVEALLFTTFGLDVRYFEQRILPSFFPDLGEGPAAEPHRPLFEYLEETPVPISVFFDHGNLVNGDKPAEQLSAVVKELRWQAHSVRGHNNCFHPKLMVALVQREDGTRGIVVGSASANLTNPGWGKNLEVCALTTSWLHDDVQDSVLVDLQSLLGYLSGVAYKSESLKLISASIELAKPRPFRRRKENFSYRPRFWHSALGRSLDKFLSDDVLHSDLSGGNWHLEVISPYYSKTPTALLTWAKGQLNSDSKKVGRILCCCPQSEGMFDITVDTATAHADLDGSAWAALDDKWTRSQFKDAQGSALTRFLHAKVFRFWCAEAEVLIVGSANATAQGCRDHGHGNDEACLIFSRVARPRSPFKAWLKALEQAPDESSCRPDEALEPDESAQDKVPYITAVFDWWTSNLALKNLSRETVSFYIAGRQEPVAMVGPGKTLKLSNNRFIRDALFRSPVVRAAAVPNQHQRYLYLVEELNLQAKPPAPTMDRNADDLIRDWQQSFEDRLSEHAAQPEFAIDVSSRRAASVELARSETDRLNDVFLALGKFRRDILEMLTPSASDMDKFSRDRVAYRVFGAGTMSVRNLVRKLFDAANPSESEGPALFDVVELYICVLCVSDSVDYLAQVLRKAKFGKQVRVLRSELSADLKAARKRLLEQLSGEMPTYPPDQLLEWVERHFSDSIKASPRT